jgi:subtilisin family serine protease
MFLLLLSSSPALERRTYAEHEGSHPRRKLSKGLLTKLDSGHGADFVRVIVQPAGRTSLSDSTLEGAGGSSIRKFRNFSSRVVTLPAKSALALASRNDVSYVSLNLQVRTLGHLSATTGTDQVRDTPASGRHLDGTGIGIAILDSGIDTDHRSFLDQYDVGRVLYSQDFTGENRTDDPYGHGTHVASLAAGNGRISNAQYVGVAPNANLINLRVLNSEGVGRLLVSCKHSTGSLQIGPLTTFEL